VPQSSQIVSASRPRQAASVSLLFGQSFVAAHRLSMTILISAVEFVAWFLSNPEGLDGMGVSNCRRGIFGAENGG
jgi:hypothetical protein